MPGDLAGILSNLRQWGGWVSNSFPRCCAGLFRRGLLFFDVGARKVRDDGIQVQIQEGLGHLHLAFHEPLKKGVHDCLSNLFDEFC